MGLGEIKLVPLSESECISLYMPGFRDLTHEQLDERSRIAKPVLLSCYDHKMNKHDISGKMSSWFLVEAHKYLVVIILTIRFT
ncbi:MAG: hypothetical protein PG981_001381 [Wolbachia endosymbiont of Ctenocephalides orientis wCori]|nr:MAG: hypothetical protein PG981_001381 [Wolbachia endosymbiont of Ctenocephalides orientis wCori]